MDVVGHDGLIPSCSEDGGGVDLQELGGLTLPSYFSDKWGRNLHG
jgi:hypothetical protein